MSDGDSSENQTTAEVEPVTEETKPTEEEFDPFAMPMDELKTKIESEIYSPEPEETPEPEAEAEASSEEEAPSEPEEPTDEEAEEDVPSEAEEFRAALEASDARAKHFESLLGRQAGEDNFWKKKAEDLERRAAEPQAAEPGETYPEVEQEPQRPQPPRTDSTTTYLVGLAIKDAGQKFFADTPEVFVEDKDTKQQVLDPEFSKILGSADSKYAELQYSNDPIHAAAEVERLLSSSWAKVDRERKETRYRDIQRMRAEQGKRLKDKKRASAASSTGRSVKPRTPKPKDPYKMPMDELRKLAEEEA